nr:histidine phosphatase family protein [Pseudopedobacter sp.]
MNIYLIRHTAVYNPNKLCYGQSEIPLEENFTADFDWIKDHLNLSENTLYFSSSFRRCTKLAAFLSDDDYQTDERLSELNFGTWEMKAWSEIPVQEMNPWMEDFVNYKIPKGENFIDLYDRVVSFYEDLTAQDTDDVVITTHAGVIRSLIAFVLGFPLENVFNLQIDYSSTTKLSYYFKNQSSKLDFMNVHKGIFTPLVLKED